MDAESTWRRSRANILTGVAVTPSSEMTLSSAWKAADACGEPYMFRSDNRMVNFQQGVKINKKLFDARVATRHRSESEAADASPFKREVLE